MAKRILIGEIATAHGIKGFVKVRCFADDPGLLESGPLFTGESGDATITLSLENSTNKGFTGRIKGVVDRNEAERLRGTKLYIDRDDLPDTDDGEYYYEDLKNMAVVDEAGTSIGTILSVENFGAGDLLDIQKTGSAESFYLIFSEDTVINVDLEAHVMTVRLPEEIE